MKSKLEQNIAELKSSLEENMKVLKEDITMKWENVILNRKLQEQKNKELLKQLKKTENLKKTLSETQKKM